MESFLELVKHYGNIAILGSSLVVMKSFTTIGPGRAFTLALRSRLFRRPNPMTCRTEEFQKLRTKLMNKTKPQYLVVTGPKGVGKTVLVRSATATCGVVEIDVHPGTSGEMIVSDAYSAIVAPFISYSFLSYERMALRVLWFYNLFARQPPTIVVHLKERSEGNKAFADITGAVRQLSENGFQIIVDSSTHAAPINLLRTGRQIIINVDYMSAAMVSRVDRYKSLFETLQKYDLVSLVWDVVGGLPSELEKLCSASAAPDPEEEIFSVLKEAICQAERDCLILFDTHCGAHVGRSSMVKI